MNADPDDDALNWDGDQDPQSALPKGWQAVGKGSDRVNPDEDGTLAQDGAPAPYGRPASASAAGPNAADADGDETVVAGDAEPAGLGSAALLALGVLGGVYLLYTVGWVVGGLRLQTLAPLIVSDAMYIPWFVLAVGAPTLWFLTTWVCTRRRATWVRMALLAAGAVLLIPWPFVTMGALGA